MNHSVSYLALILPIDVTFNTGEETERRRRQKNLVKNNNYPEVRCSRGTVDKSRDST